MNNNEFTPEELALIERMRNAPQPRLKSTAFDKIKAQMMLEFEQMPLPQPEAAPDAAPKSAPQPTPGTGLPTALPLPILITGGVIVIVIAAMIAVIGGQILVPLAGTTTATPTVTITVSPSITATETAIMTATASPTEIPSSVPTLEASVVIQPTLATNTDTATSTLTTTLSPTPTVVSTLTPTPTPTEDLDSVIVLEGEITDIEANNITIFDIQIQVALNDPVLLELHVGDLIRVVGVVQQSGGTIIVMAAEVVRVDNVGSNQGQSGGNGNGQLPPNCRLNPAGKLVCTPNKGSKKK